MCVLAATKDGFLCEKPPLRRISWHPTGRSETTPNATCRSAWQGRNLGTQPKGPTRPRIANCAIPNRPVLHPQPELPSPEESWPVLDWWPSLSHHGRGLRPPRHPPRNVGGSGRKGPSWPGLGTRQLGGKVVSSFATIVDVSLGAANLEGDFVGSFKTWQTARVAVTAEQDILAMEDFQCWFPSWNLSPTFALQMTSTLSNCLLKLFTWCRWKELLNQSAFQAMN